MGVGLMMESISPKNSFRRPPKIIKAGRTGEERREACRLHRRRGESLDAGEPAEGP